MRRLAPKRHQHKHLDFGLLHFGTRGSEVQSSPQPSKFHIINESEYSSFRESRNWVRFGPITKSSTAVRNVEMPSQRNSDGWSLAVPKRRGIARSK